MQSKTVHFLSVKATVLNNNADVDFPASLLFTKEYFECFYFPNHLWKGRLTLANPFTRESSRTKTPQEPICRLWINIVVLEWSRIILFFMQGVFTIQRSSAPLQYLCSAGRVVLSGSGWTFGRFTVCYVMCGRTNCFMRAFPRALCSVCWVGGVIVHLMTLR